MVIPFLCNFSLGPQYPFTLTLKNPFSSDETHRLLSISISLLSISISLLSSSSFHLIFSRQLVIVFTSLSCPIRRIASHPCASLLYLVPNQKVRFGDLFPFSCF
eukprot:TRINITY_DN6981_c0_g1_i4.p1 TRINITY_DN6981_c0_g1~~TRINITY_DN6981_c0_g1_i4.p1  ORF type:complete len:104 (+),score=6.54 TRINITY_DN6981_c0_g1_i4:21-332(+)